MENQGSTLQETAELVINILPRIWFAIRGNLRSAATTKFSISLEQFHILRHIHKGYTSVAELAEVKGTSRSAVSQAVQILVEKDLVTREVDPNDRRSANLKITPYAEEVLNANMEDTRRWIEEKMQELSAEDLKKVQEAMQILNNTFIPNEK